MNKLDIQDFERITTLRHDMHVCRNPSKWISMNSELIEEVKKLNETINIKDYDIEDLFCNEDDCGIESCSKCDEIEADFLSDNKDKTNTVIEEFLENMEEKHDLCANSICPTGMSRLRWSESV